MYVIAFNFSYKVPYFLMQHRYEDVFSQNMGNYIPLNRHFGALCLQS